MRPRYLLWLVAASLVALVTTACARGRAPDPPPVRAAVHEGVCAAAEAAAAGDRAGARAAFADVHGPLHALAGQLEEQDRGAAGRLLEAKQRAEAGLESGPAPPAGELDALAAEVRAALDVIGADGPTTCP